MGINHRHRDHKEEVIQLAPVRNFAFKRLPIVPLVARRRPRKRGTPNACRNLDAPGSVTDHNAHETPGAGHVHRRSANAINVRGGYGHFRCGPALQIGAGLHGVCDIRVAPVETHAQKVPGNDRFGQAGTLFLGRVQIESVVH